MISARRLYRLNVLVAVVAASVLLAGGLTAISSLTLALPPIAALRTACEKLLPESGPGGLVVLLLLLLPVLTSARGAQSLSRQVGSSRRFLRLLGRARTLRIMSTDVIVIDDPRTQAFCAGYLRPRVYISTAALQRLSRDELRAVVAHEAHHRARRDPLRILVAGTLADALFFLPAARRLSDRYRELCELAADEAALKAGCARAAIASGVLAFGRSAGPSTVVGIAPERVDHLLGRPARWRLPALLLPTSLLIGSLLAAATVTAAGMRMNLATVVVDSCMFLMAAAVAGGVATALMARSPGAMPEVT